MNSTEKFGSDREVAGSIYEEETLLSVGKEKEREREKIGANTEKRKRGSKQNRRRVEKRQAPRPLQREKERRKKKEGRRGEKRGRKKKERPEEKLVKRSKLVSNFITPRGAWGASGGRVQDAPGALVYFLRIKKFICK